MTIQSYIEERLLPQATSSALEWYLNMAKTDDFLDIQEMLDMMRLNLNIILPEGLPAEAKRLYIGLTFLTYECELEEMPLPSTYRLKVNDIGYIDEARDPLAQLNDLVTGIVGKYHEAVNTGDQTTFHRYLKICLCDWNWGSYVVQEELMEQLSSPLRKVAESMSLPVDIIFRIFHDYVERQRNRQLKNMEEFLRRARKLMQDNHTPLRYPELAEFVAHLETGGEFLNMDPENASSIHHLRCN